MTWFAIKTKTGKERSVRHTFKRDGETCYLPASIRRKKLQKGALGRRRIIPTFPGYLFLKGPGHETEALWLHKIIVTDDVLSFIKSDGRPARIQDEKIEWLRQAIAGERRSDIERREKTKIRKGIDARAKDGPFRGFTGTVTWTRANKTRVLIWVLGSPREVTFETTQLEVA